MVLILSLLRHYGPPAVPKFIGILLNANGSRLNGENLKIAILPTRAM